MTPKHKKVKVAHITTIDGSLRSLLLDQIGSLQAAGYDVTGISSPGQHVPFIVQAGVPHIAVPMTRRISPFADLRSLYSLYRVMRREDFTIVHTHTPKPGLLGQLAAHAAGVPVIVNTLHGFYFHEHMQPVGRQFYILMEKIAARFSDVILSQNSEDIRTAIDERIAVPGQIKYLGNGISLERFDPLRVDPALVQEKRKELGISPTDKVVGFVGRMVAEKGILELLEAARVVVNQRSDTIFVAIGRRDPEKRDAVSAEIVRDPRLRERFIFTGLRYDMPALYAMMDVFTLPSHREGFPRSAMEASAMGIPSVMTDIRGCREVVEDGRNGLLVPLGNVQRLAEAILALLDAPIRREQMGREGREIALQRFDERVVFKRVASEYARLLEEKGLPSPILAP